MAAAGAFFQEAVMKVSRWQLLLAPLFAIVLSGCGMFLGDEMVGDEIPEEMPQAEPFITETHTPTPTATATEPPPPTATGTATSTVVPTNTPTAPPPATVFGRWRIVTSYFEGDQEHVIYILLPESTTVEVREGSIIFDGEETWVDVTGELQPDGSFEAEGTGMVAGFPNILVTFTGTITSEGLEGHYTMGADGKLPGGQSVTYLVEGTLED